MTMLQVAAIVLGGVWVTIFIAIAIILCLAGKQSGARADAMEAAARQDELNQSKEEHHAPRKDSRSGA